MAACIGTWSFAIKPVKHTKTMLLRGTSALDAIETSVADFEDDVGTGLYLVGRGGMPNSEGVAQYDAAMMNGKDLSYGAVAALEGFPTPIRVARKVMTECKHNVLVGPGARLFALNQGFTPVDNDELLSDQGLKAARENNYKANRPAEPNDSCASSNKSDTLGVIALDDKGDIAVGVTTSGMAFKHPGRVGDSPLIGAGLYADNLGGAACATGDGDEILKYCPSFHVVHLLRMGKNAQEACTEVLKDIVKRRGTANELEIGIIAMDMQGNHGAAGWVKEWEDEHTKTVYKGFPYACWSQGGEEEVRTAPCITSTLS